MIVEKQVVANNISRLINQVWKLIPMRENNENWKKQIDCLLVEMRGLQALFSEDLDFLIAISSLEGLRSSDDIEFVHYRSVVFSIISILGAQSDKLI